MEIRIVEYNEIYAAKVADMWNHSRDGWGGANTVDTEESVLHREGNSTNIHTFLAIEGDKVVGYCGLSEYRDDEGALYIPLLNVRDDYHGKKIGKKLLLTALEEAIQLKWPRLDLYTWPGNTKAVPLYKKCGFFWEERDDTTHLMNFIPAVLRTEAVADFFQDVNWYENSSRKIEVKPDGRVENDFHYYEYAWAKEDKMLRMEFERTGRGIRLIETEDYLISAEVPAHQLVFGNQYKITYTIKNKSGRPLHIDLTGKSDQNIEFSFDESFDVTDEREIEGTFYIGSIEEEQNKDRTHPSVQAIVQINGKQAIFKVGILPKYPAKVSAQFPEDLSFIGKEYVFYLDMVNNYAENVRFEMELPSSNLLELKDQQLQIDMKAKERKSVAVPFIVNKHGYYHALLNMKAIKENGEVVHFLKEIGIPLRGMGSKFSGEDEENLQLYNGQYFAVLDKSENEIQIGRKKKESHLSIMTPKVGKPYSEEIARAKIEERFYFEGTGYIAVKLTYQLTAFSGLRLHVIIKLYNEGLVENYYEVENIRDERTEHSVWVNQSIYSHLNRAVLPYRNEIVEMNDSIGNSYEYWDDQGICENWMFIKDDVHPVGITWNKADKIHFDSWFHYFEHHLGQIDANSSLQSNAVFFSIGAFHDVASFREFATQSNNGEKVKQVNHLRVSLENNNPFIQGEELVCQVTNYKSNYLHGELELALLPGKENVNLHVFDRKEQKNEWTAELNITEAPLVSTVNLKAKLDAAIQERETLVIRQSNTDFMENVVQEKGFDVWKLSNGLIEMKAAPDFYPALHSLTYDGQEWLDTSYPDLLPKLWWNPWSGGLSSRLSNIRTHSISKEKTIASFTALTDNRGNEWRGIKLTTSIERHEEFKGLTYHQYFLLLPGVPVLCHVSEVEQATGTFFDGKDWQTTAFFKPGINMEENWVNIQDPAGEWTKIVAGKDENDLEVARSFVVGCDQQGSHLQIISDTEKSTRVSYVNKQVILTGVSERLTMPSDTRKFTIPNFYLFNNQVIHDNAQHDLQGIRFR